MSKDKLEDDAKKRVREETEQIEGGDAPWQKSEKPGDSGTCSRICGVIWRTPRIQKRMLRAGREPCGPSSHLSRSGRKRSHPQGRSAA